MVSNRTLSLPLLPITLLTACCSFAEQPEEVSVSAEEIFAALDLSRPNLSEVAAAVEARDYELAVTAWSTYFRERREPVLHFDRGEWPDFMRAEFPQVGDAMVGEARKIIGGTITHGTFQLPVQGRFPGGKIDWFHNPGLDTNYVSAVGSQWFLNCLGRAYLLTEEEVFAETFAQIFNSWIENQDRIVKEQGGLGINPIYRAYYPGVQTRILLDNYYCLSQSEALTGETHLRIMRQLLANARFLFGQQQGYRKGNQQVTAVLGLGMMGLFLPEFREADQWLERAESLMARHLGEDFFGDGGHKELCTQYQKTCLRDIGYVALTSENNGRTSPLLRGTVGASLERSYDWLAQLVTPGGQTPPLHSAVFSTDYAIHLLISSAFFKRSDHSWLARRFWKRGMVPSQKLPVALSVYMLAPPLSCPREESATTPTYNSVLLEESGFAVHRTGWEESDRYLVFQYGHPNTGHAYPAALSCLLQMNGELIATHPGSPRSYRHPAYAYCQETQAHNTVTLNGESYPRVGGIAPGGALHRHADLPGLWYVDGSHEGYRSTANAVHRRQVVAIEDGPVLWIDEIECNGPLVAHWSFHTPLTTEVLDDRRVTLTGKSQYHLVTTDPFCEIQEDKRWATLLPEDCQPDDCGGEVNVLRFEKTVPRGVSRIAIGLFEEAGDVVNLGKNAYRLLDPEVEYVVLVGSKDEVTEVEGISAKAHLAVLKFKSGDPASAWVVDGTYLRVGDEDALKEEIPQTGRLEIQSP